MYIEMLATSATPDGIMHAGKVYSVPKKQAEALLAPDPHGRAYAKPASRPDTVHEIAKPPEPEPMEVLGE